MTVADRNKNLDTIDCDTTAKWPQWPRNYCGIIRPEGKYKHIDTNYCRIVICMKMGANLLDQRPMNYLPTHTLC